MPDRLVPLNGKETLRKLKKAGFEVIRTKGSAHYLRHPRTGRFTSVHVHGNRIIPIGTLKAIVIEQAGLTVEEFNRL
jgi:predicted RNA binding protein YcfA (HicA-like mRNA interferase family)